MNIGQEVFGGSRRTSDLCIEIAPCQMRNRLVAVVNEYKRAFPFQFVALEGETREGEATAVNMFTSSSLNQFVAREGEAPAEPWRPQLGRSLALP